MKYTLDRGTRGLALPRSYSFTNGTHAVLPVRAPDVDIPRLSAETARSVPAAMLPAFAVALLILATVGEHAVYKFVRDDARPVTTTSHQTHAATSPTSSTGPANSKPASATAPSAAAPSTPTTTPPASPKVSVPIVSTTAPVIGGMGGGVVSEPVSAVTGTVNDTTGGNTGPVTQPIQDIIPPPSNTGVEVQLEMNISPLPSVNVGVGL